MASLALGQSYDCPNASEAILKNMDKWVLEFPLDWFHKCNKTKIQWIFHDEKIPILQLWTYVHSVIIIHKNLKFKFKCFIVCLSASQFNAGHSFPCWFMSRSNQQFWCGWSVPQGNCLHPHGCGTIKSIGDMIMTRAYGPQHYSVQ